MRTLLFMGLLLMTAGCVNQRWSQYDSSLYRVAMEPSVESHEAHAKLLRDFSESKEGLPPGLAAELGFYLALLGQAEEANTWFEREIAAHSESAPFVAALRAIGPDAEEGDPEQ
jgi:hypothetical protein